MNERNLDHRMGEAHVEEPRGVSRFEVEREDIRLRGSDRLTARERDVLAMISQGGSNKRIARTLEISPETVKSHVKRIFLKLAVSNRTEAVIRALSLELL
jgi:DNA-binding CsgD family transcriptional regulator